MGESEVNRNDRLFSWVTLEPVEQIELDDPSEKTIEEMDDVFEDIENRVTVLGNAIENRVNVLGNACEEIVQVLESPEKTIEVSNDRSQVINMNVINDHTNDKKTNKEKEEKEKEKKHEKEENIKSGTTADGTNAKKDQEKGKYPCGTCKVDVTDEGIQCQRCKLWFHFGPCSEVDGLEDYKKEYKNKKYKCTECEKEKEKEKKEKEQEKRKPGRPKLPNRKAPIKCKVPTSSRRITGTVEIKIKKNTKRQRKIREDEPSGEELNDANKNEKSPMKKKSKAEGGKDENEIKFPIEIMGENLSKSDLKSLDEGQCVTSTVLDIYMKTHETTYEKEIKDYNIELIKTLPSYMIQKGNKHETTTQLLNPIKIWEKIWHL